MSFECRISNGMYREEIKGWTGTSYEFWLGALTEAA